MKHSKIYPNEWMQIHPYTQQQPSDMYFVGLANRLYESLKESELPDTYQRKLALYAAAYLEDLISGLGLWESHEIPSYLANGILNKLNR